jgi:hypothetical protein
LRSRGGDVRIETELSGISAGTELSFTAARSLRARFSTSLASLSGTGLSARLATPSSAESSLRETVEK